VIWSKGQRREREGGSYFDLSRGNHGGRPDESSQHLSGVSLLGENGEESETGLCFRLFRRVKCGISQTL